MPAVECWVPFSWFALHAAKIQLFSELQKIIVFFLKIPIQSTKIDEKKQNRLIFTEQKFGCSRKNE
jgi:hypothetical protein